MRRKFLCLLIGLFILLNLMTYQVNASDENSFCVQFVENTSNFVATGYLSGINRCILLVYEPTSNNLVYTDANNEISGDFYFEINLGESLTNGEYTFVLCSDGSNVESFVSMCVSTIVAEANWFNVEYARTSRKFVIKGELDGTNRLMLMVYEPYLDGKNGNLIYFDAINECRGAFEFEVPLDSAPLAGTYEFVVLGDGDMCTYGKRRYYVDRVFTKIGYMSDKTEFGAEYMLEDGQQVESVSVFLAIYKIDSNGDMAFERIERECTVTEHNGKRCIVVKTTIPNSEGSGEYCAKAFVWSSFSEIKPLADCLVFE